MRPRKIFISFFVIVVLVILTSGIIYFGYFNRNLQGNPGCSTKLSAEVLNESLDIGTKFLLNNQKEEGNFYYEYDWRSKKDTAGDNQVRQAGAVWGLALIYQAKHQENVRNAFLKAISFFEKHSQVNDKSERFIVYPGDKHGSTGTVALVALAIIDFLRADIDKLSTDNLLAKLRQELTEYINFLKSARQANLLWYSKYDPISGKPFGEASPYFDGEALLALIKAAKYLEYQDLKELILSSAEAGYQMNIKEALSLHPDSSTTKGYYQWSSMAFYEIASTGWENTSIFGDHVLELADWVIDVHAILERMRNTAYAFEGITHAYMLAKIRYDEARQKKYSCAIERGLEKLTSWQVGSSIANQYINRIPNNDPRALGGVQNHKSEPALRIDVTQHQMHAVILALRLYYGEKDNVKN